MADASNSEHTPQTSVYTSAPTTTTLTRSTANVTPAARGASDDEAPVIGVAQDDTSHGRSPLFPAPKVRRRGRPPKTANSSRVNTERASRPYPVWRTSTAAMKPSSSVLTTETSSPTSLDLNTPPLMVFQCHQCLTIVGDSVAWLLAQRQLGLIVLQEVTDKVLTLEFLTTSEDQGWERCKFAPLACAKCDQILGRFYKDTPPEWTIMRGAFSLYHSALVVYQLGTPRGTPKRTGDGRVDPDAGSQRLQADLRSLRPPDLMSTDRRSSLSPPRSHASYIPSSYTVTRGSRSASPSLPPMTVPDKGSPAPLSSMTSSTTSPATTPSSFAKVSRPAQSSTSSPSLSAALAPSGRTTMLPSLTTTSSSSLTPNSGPPPASFSSGPMSYPSSTPSSVSGDKAESSRTDTDLEKVRFTLFLVTLRRLLIHIHYSPFFFLMQIRTLLMVMGERLMRLEQYLPVPPSSTSYPSSTSSSSSSSTATSATSAATAPPPSVPSIIDDRSVQRHPHAAWDELRQISPVSTYPCVDASARRNSTTMCYPEDTLRRWPPRRDGTRALSDTARRSLVLRPSPSWKSGAPPDNVNSRPFCPPDEPLL